GPRLAREFRGVWVATIFCGTSSSSPGKVFDLPGNLSPVSGWFLNAMTEKVMEHVRWGNGGPRSATSRAAASLSGRSGDLRGPATPARAFRRSRAAREPGRLHQRADRRGLGGGPAWWPKRLRAYVRGWPAPHPGAG